MLDKYLELEKRRLEENSLLNEDYTFLYEQDYSDSEDLILLLSSYHSWFNEELRDFNNGVNYGYYHAERSRRTSAMLRELHRFTNQLRTVVKLSPKYASIKNQLNSLLGRSGTHIPEGFENIDIDEVVPIFESKENKVVVHNKKIELEFIDSGSYAKVFKYYDEYYNKEFVVKKANADLTSKELERFKREFEVMKEIKSPYVVEVYSYNDEEKSYIMELMDIPLWDYLQEAGDSLPLKDRLNLVGQILRAFQHLRDNGYLHRDISPKNVLLRDYNGMKVVKVSDFGLVKPKDSQLTSKGSKVRGSLNDPKLNVTGFQNYDEKHETYALTQLIVIILSGKYPFHTLEEGPLKDFLIKGVSDYEKRFQNLEELKAEYLKVKKELCV